MPKTTDRVPFTPEQQLAYDAMNSAWKIAARAVAADMPFHIPANLVRRALASNMDVLIEMVGCHAAYRQTLQPTPPILEEVNHPIPPLVYWGEEQGNFYGMTSRRGQGQEFFGTWYNRRHEFPTSPHEDDAA